MMKDDIEENLIASPWQSHGAVYEVEVVGHWDMDDACTDDGTDDDTDNDNDDEAIWLWWW